MCLEEAEYLERTCKRHRKGAVYFLLRSLPLFSVVSFLSAVCLFLPLSAEAV